MNHSVALDVWCETEHLPGAVAAPGPTSASRSCSGVESIQKI